MQQAANKFLMVRPAAFAYNNQTAGSNSFQKVATLSHQAVHELALKEFDEAIKKLSEHDVDVYVVHDTSLPHKPDAIFPNNWFSIHGDSIVLYPMAAPNRRLERGNALVGELMHTKRRIDLSFNENENRFLEGTGSLVLDRVNHIAFACISPRTNDKLVMEWCDLMNYKPVLFHAEVNRQPVYHTNVVMSLGNQIAVCCVDALVDDKERTLLIKSLTDNHELLQITLEQMNRFAGNMLLVRNKLDVAYWVMSQTAFDSLEQKQKNHLNKDGDFIILRLDTVEKFGGGSARCMLVEVGW